MIVQQAQDPKALAVQVIEEQLSTAPTLMIVVNGPMLVGAALRQGLELDAVAAYQALKAMAPLFGFRIMRHDSKGHPQWQRENPRFVLCRKHRVRGAAVAIIEGGSVSFRCVHRYKGRTESCRLGQVRISLLIKFLPKLPADLLSQFLGVRPTSEGFGLKNGGGE